MNTKILKRFVALAGFLVVLALTSVAFVGWMLSRPVQTRVGDGPFELNAQAITFSSGSGATVGAWWCPVPESHGTVLLLPGVRANRWSQVDRALFLRRAGYSTLLIDFQASGETKGDCITFGWKESFDVLAAVEFIRKMRPADHIGIIGCSLGGAAALLANPPLKVDALILEAAYPTIQIATENRLGNWLGPFGKAAAPLLLLQLPIRLGLSANALRPIDHIANVGCPVFLISGDKDRDTRPNDTRMLFALAQSPKELWFVANAGHVDLHQAGGAEYESRVLAFLSRM